MCIYIYMYIYICIPTSNAHEGVSHELQLNMCMIHTPESFII